MTPDEREEVRAAILNLLTCSAAFEVSMFEDRLRISPLPDGRFCVSLGRADTSGWGYHPEETLYNKAEAAVDAFLTLRESQRLGFDFERAPRRPMPYDKGFGDDKDCACGHPYYRHFDTYDNMSPIGCKYCDCHTWQSPDHPLPERYGWEAAGEGEE